LRSYFRGRTGKGLMNLTMKQLTCSTEYFLYYIHADNFMVFNSEGISTKLINSERKSSIKWWWKLALHYNQLRSYQSCILANWRTAEFSRDTSYGNLSDNESSELEIRRLLISSGIAKIYN
jgi:hypothetical protein